MTAQRRLSGALALTCVITALTPAVAGAMPRIDPPTAQDAGTTTCAQPVPRAATADCGASSDFDGSRSCSWLAASSSSAAASSRVRACATTAPAESPPPARSPLPSVE